MGANYVILHQSGTDITQLESTLAKVPEGIACTIVTDNSNLEYPNTKVVERESVSDFESIAISLSEASKGLTVLMDSRFDQDVSRSDLTQAIRLFQKHQPSVLISQNYKAEELPAIIIYDAESARKRGKVLGDMPNSYVYMIGDTAARFDPEVDGPAEGETEYSSEDQLGLAEMYKDNIGDYWGKKPEEMSGDLLRSSRDVPQRVQTLVSIPKPGERILDIGCSAGVVSILYGGQGADVTGVDIVPSLIEDANKRLAEAPEEVQNRVRFLLGDVNEIDLPRKSFDAITATEFYEHLPHIVIHGFMQHVLPFLKEDGYVVVSVPNRYPKKEYVDEMRHRWDWYNHLTHWTRRSLEEFVGTYFEDTEFKPIYPEDAIEEGIWLSCIGRKRRD